MSSTDEEEESDAPEEILSSYSSGTSWVHHRTPSTEDHSSFSDHSENYEMDEAIQRRIIEDWPDEVWQEHYENKPHVKEDTCYVIDGDTSHQWAVIDMISEAEPVVLAHIAACDANQKFTYGDEQFTSAKDVTGVSGSYERPDRRLKTTFLVASKHFHGIPPGIRNHTNPRIYVSAIQFGNLAHVVELDKTVTMSPGMLAYVEGKGWSVIQNITAYNKGRQR